MTSRRSAIRGTLLCLALAAVSVAVILWQLAGERGSSASASPRASGPAPRSAVDASIADPGEPLRIVLPAADVEEPAPEPRTTAPDAPTATAVTLLDLSLRSVFVEVQSEPSRVQGFAVSGRVVLDGLPPPPVAVVPDDGTLCCNRNNRLDRSWRVGPEGGLADVVVELDHDPHGLEPRRSARAPLILGDDGRWRPLRERGAMVRVSEDLARDARRRYRRQHAILELLDREGSGRRPRAHSLDVRCCRFEPRVLAVAPHARVLVRNHDGRAHLDGLDELLEPGAMTLLDPGSGTWPRALELSSWLHPWMEARIYVGESARPEVTATDGRFELPAVAVDPVVLRLWHTELGTAEVVFQLPVPSPGRRIPVRDWRAHE